MATGGFDAEAAQNTHPTCPRLTYCGPNLVLTKGSTLPLQSRFTTETADFGGMGLQ